MAKNDGNIQCWKNLATSIVLQAVKDWNGLMKGQKFTYPTQYRTKHSPIKVSFKEIRKFFNNEYGEYICDSIRYDAQRLLGELERRKADNEIIDIDALEYEIMQQQCEGGNL